MRDSPSAVAVRVAVERLSGVGPWIDESVDVLESARVN